MAVLFCQSPGAPGYREAWRAGDPETFRAIAGKVLPRIGPNCTAPLTVRQQMSLLIPWAVPYEN